MSLLFFSHNSQSNMAPNTAHIIIIMSNRQIYPESYAREERRGIRTMYAKRTCFGSFSWYKRCVKGWKVLADIAINRLVKLARKGRSGNLWKQHDGKFPIFPICHICMGLLGVVMLLVRDELMGGNIPNPVQLPALLLCHPAAFLKIRQSYLGSLFHFSLQHWNIFQ